MIGVVLIGFVAGAFAGLLGIGGGALFVPALVLIVGLKPRFSTRAPSGWRPDRIGRPYRLLRIRLVAK